MLVENPVVITEETLRKMARRVKGGIGHIYLHWTAGHYGQVYDEYHLCIDKDGTVYVNCKYLIEYKAHTWMRNHAAIGIALCCGVDAGCWLPHNCEGCLVETAYENPHCVQADCALVDYGPEPPTPKQVDVMADIVAILCNELRLPITPETVQTHCEAAFEDDYGPGDGDPDMRWDLWFLPEGADSGRLVPGGELIRGKAQYYLERMDADDLQEEAA